LNNEATSLRQYSELIRAGHPLNLDFGNFSEETTKDLKRLLSISREAGGPISVALDRMSSVISVREQTRTELALAVAGPKASSRLVMSLPILVFLGAGISGIPIFRTLSTVPLVWGSLLTGALFFWWGNRWISKLLTKAEPRLSDPGLELDGLAIAVQAGMPLQSAIELVRFEAGESLSSISGSSGIALAKLLTDRASQLRQQQFNEDRLLIQRTGVSVLWPLGLTVLPAFVLIAIVPVAAALIQDQI
jgi:tight adherence protein B